MNQRQVVVFALFGSLLMVTAPTATAASTSDLDIGSQHTTESDFNNAAQLTNLTVSGGSVDLFGTWATFDDQPADAGIPDGFENVSGAAEVEEVSTSRSVSGSQSWLLDNDGGGTTVASRRPATQPYGTAATDPISVQMYHAKGTQSRVALYEGGTRLGFVAIYNGDLQWYNGAFVTLSTAVNESEWVEVDIETKPSTDEFTISWQTASTSGSQTVSAENAISNGYTETRFETNSARAFFDNIDIADPESATYISQNHSVSAAERAQVDLSSLSDASATITAEYWTGSAWKVGNSTTVSTAGTHEIALPDVQSETWRMKIDVDKSASEPQFTLADEAILFYASAPAASNIKPSDGTKLNDSSVEFSLDLSDPDFGLAQGDTVTAKLYLRGPDDSSFSQVHSTSVTSNQTVQTTEKIVEGGETDYYWKLTDSYGEETTTATRTISVPDTLYIRNESDPSQLVNNSTVEMTFYSSDAVVTKTTSDGSVNLSGLPVTEQIVVSASADGYYSRNIIIEDIYSQRSVYLLNKSKSANEVRFVLDDTTGQFPQSETEIYVERVLTLNNTTKYRTVAADEFGVEGFTVDLRADQRYRLIIENNDGDTRVLGHYTASVSETVELRPVPLGVDLDEGNTTYAWDSYYEKQDSEIIFEYSDPKNNRTDLQVTSQEKGNTSNEIVNTSFDGPLGSVSVVEPLTQNQSNKSWVVEWSAKRGGGTIDGQETVGKTVSDLVPGLADWLKHTIAILIIIMTGGLFSQLNAGVGGVTTALVGGGFWMGGWLPTNAGAAITIALAIAILYKIATPRV